MANSFIAKMSNFEPKNDFLKFDIFLEDVTNHTKKRTKFSV